MIISVISIFLSSYFALFGKIFYCIYGVKATAGVGLALILSIRYYLIVIIMCSIILIIITFIFNKIKDKKSKSINE